MFFPRDARGGRRSSTQAGEEAAFEVVDCDLEAALLGRRCPCLQEAAARPTQRNAQRLHRGIRGPDAPLQFFIDEPHQRADFRAVGRDLFRVAQVLRTDEFFETRIRALHEVKTLDVIACLQRERLNVGGFRGSGERGNVSHAWPPRGAVY
jgi:hypothetical protein